MKVLKSKDIPTLREKWLKEQKGLDALYTHIKVLSPTLDHDHSSGRCRGVLDSNVNQFLGKVESAYKRFLKYRISDLPELLRKTAQYLEHNRERENIIHPRSVSHEVRKFHYLDTASQDRILEALNVKIDKKGRKKITKRDKAKMYRNHLTKKENIWIKH